MPEPLKNLYSENLLKDLSKHFKAEHSEFKKQAFIKQSLSTDWGELELKDRMRRVSTTLGDFLPQHYPDAIRILLPVSSQFSGLEHLLFPDFIEQFGLNHFELSMDALEFLTPGSSSEFAIRPFILQNPHKTMKRMAKWSLSKDEHVRRLACEGCRPRLPWAIALPEYKKDPSAVLKIILKLMDDESLYVRRSVANNLNDISKDNPHLVIDTARQYLGQSPETDWVIKHACRSLLKQGNKKVLPLFGYKKASHVSLDKFKVDKKVSNGEKLNFEFELTTQKKKLGMLRIEFIIDFMKANNKSSEKIFKISEGDFLENNKSIKKYFSFKAISTRKYYPGKHAISIIINGDKIATKVFQLEE